MSPRAEGEASVKIPLLMLVMLFVGALGGIVTWVYAEDKADDEQVAELKKKAALTDQTLQQLTEQLKQLNDSLKEKSTSQDDTNAMLRKLLEKQKVDPDEVIKKAKKKKDDKKPKEDE